MHIKRYEASSLIEAVRRVKAELGPDALILSQRCIRREGRRFGLLGRSRVEVTAAVDREARRAPDRGGSTRIAPDPSWRELQLTRALVAPVEEELRSLRRSMEAMAGSAAEREVLGRELAALRRAAADLREQTPATGAEPAAGRLAGHLLELGVAPRHAFPLAREAAARGDPAAVAPDRVLAPVVAARLDRRLVPPRPDEEPGPQLFVGPTGVGKTTTLAKLAAREASEERSLAVVTTDAARLGAEAQLRSYAERIGVGFHVAVSSNALGDTLGRVRARRVLVDTAGRSPSDEDAVPDLLACREALGPSARVRLVLSATTKEEDLMAEVARYRPLEPDGLVLTKLDESRSLGNVLNLLLDTDAPPLLWVADGQRVPEDLRLPDPDRFAAQALGAAA